MHSFLRHGVEWTERALINNTPSRRQLDQRLYRPC